MKYYVTADPHGSLTELKAALTKAGYFTDTEPHKLVILGDLLDRGKEIIETQNFILDLMAKDAVILIRGNHEDLFVELAVDDHGIAYSHHIHNGTFATAMLLTRYDYVMARLRHNEFAKAAQRTTYFNKIIPATRDFLETEHYIFTHGWIPCVQERNGQYSYIENWRESDENAWKKARWLNGMEAAAQGVTVEGKTILCGHWYTSYGHFRFEHKGSEFGPNADYTPYYGNGIIALDACIGRSHMLNCIVVED